LRYHSIKCAEGYDEKELLKWANSVVKPEVQIKRFNAKSLANSGFFFSLLEHVFEVLASKSNRKHNINYDLVMTGGDEESNDNNARYVLNMAR